MCVTVPFNKKVLYRDMTTNFDADEMFVIKEVVPVSQIEGRDTSVFPAERQTRIVCRLVNNEKARRT